MARMDTFKTAGLATLLTLSAPTWAGTIDFYEGENGTQTKHCTLSDKAGQRYNLKKKGHPCPNDDVKSVVLNDVRPGAVIRVTDDPKGSIKKDDYTVIKVLRRVQTIVIHDFEKTYKDDNVEVTYSKDNGLNGKVSHIRID